MIDDDKLPSFKPIETAEDVGNKVDEALDKIRDKVKLVDDVKRNPPKPDSMKVEIPSGLYAVDLATLLNAQLVDCPATVIPMLIDHGVRTAVDIKDSYKAEKRKLDFQYWWVLILVITIPIMILVANMFFKIF